MHPYQFEQTDTNLLEGTLTLTALIAVFAQLALPVIGIAALLYSALF